LCPQEYGEWFSSLPTLKSVDLFDAACIMRADQNYRYTTYE
jgi:hypothetical protein